MYPDVPSMKMYVAKMLQSETLPCAIAKSISAKALRSSKPSRAQKTRAGVPSWFAHPYVAKLKRSLP